MGLPRFRYCLRQDAFNYYQVAGRNVVLTSTPTPVGSSSIIDWNNTEFVFKRSPSMHGVFRSIVTNVGFVRDAALICRHIFVQFRYEGRCQLVTQELRSTDQLYYDVDVSDLDFSEYSDKLNVVKVAAKDIGLAADLKARENTTYEVDLLDADCLKVFHDGIILRGSTRYIVAEMGVATPVTLSNTFVTSPSGSEGVNESVGTATNFQPFPASLLLSTSSQYKVRYPESASVVIRSLSVYISWPNTASAAAKFVIRLLYGDPSGVQTAAALYTAPGYLSPGQNANYNIDGATNISLNANDEVVIQAVMVNASNTIVSEINSRIQVIGNGGTVEIASTYRRPATTIRAYRPIQVIGKMLAQIGGNYTVTSNYLSNQTANDVDTVPANCLMTCGDAVRGLGDGITAQGAIPFYYGSVPYKFKAAAIKTTISEFRQDLLARFMAGMGVEGDILRIEKLPYFYDNSRVTLKLEEPVTEFEMSFSKEYAWNNLKVGYNYKDNEQINGKDDPFLTLEFSSSGIRVPTEANLVSPYIASYVTQEYLRANLSGKKTTDSSNDNDTHILEVNNSPFTVSGKAFYTLRRDQVNSGNSISGIIASGSAYNLGLTPARNLLRSAPLIHTALNGLDGTALKFQTADQNAELESQLSSDVGNVIERADRQVSSLATSLFLPIPFAFKTKVPKNLMAIVAAAPYGRIEFPVLYKGKRIELAGFIDEIGRKSGNDACTWKLLACPDTDLSLLL